MGITEVRGYVKAMALAVGVGAAYEPGTRGADALMFPSALPRVEEV